MTKHVELHRYIASHMDKDYMYIEDDFHIPFTDFGQNNPPHSPIYTQSRDSMTTLVKS